MRYVEPEPMGRADIVVALSADDIDSICEALVSAAFHDADGDWVEQQCLRFSDHPEESVRGLAMVCFGHLARIHGALDLDLVLPVLRSAIAKGGYVGGRAQDALDDIAIFIPEADV